jgi:hypothetical protein
MMLREQEAPELLSEMQLAVSSQQHTAIPHVVDAAMAEAFALRDGLLLAQ